MTLPLANAPKSNHGLSTSEGAWSPNSLSSLGKAMVAVQPFEKPGGSFHPTLWARAQETWGTLQELQHFDLQSLNEPDLNEWLALLWGLCTGQIRSAYLTGSDSSAQLIFENGECHAGLKRELHFVLKATRPRGMDDQPILLFYFEHDLERVWVGGFDPRCLVFTSALGSSNWGLLEREGLAERRAGHLRLRLDLEAEVRAAPARFLGFLGYLERVVEVKTLHETTRQQMRNILRFLNYHFARPLRDLARPGTHQGPFEGDPDFPPSPLADALLRHLEVRVQIEAPEYYPHLKLKLRGQDQGIWIRCRDLDDQPNQAFTYPGQPDQPWGDRMGDAGTGRSLPYPWIDPIKAFVATRAFQFENCTINATYLPLKPEVLRYYTLAEIRAGFRLERSDTSLCLRIELPTLNPLRPFKKDVVFDCSDDATFRLVRFSPRSSAERRPLALALWPRFRHPEWTDYLIQQKLACPGMELTFHGWREGEPVRSGKVLLDNRPTLFPVPGGFPDFIELGHEGTAYGGFFPEVRELQKRETIHRLVVDLGSTNTTVAVRRTHSEEAVLLDLNLHGSSLDLIEHATTEQLADLPYKDLLGVAPDNAGEITVVPTTPMVCEERDKALENHFPIFRRQPLDYPKTYFKHARLRTEAEWRFLPGIKFNQAQSIQKAYVKSLLTLVWGQLCTRYGTFITWESLVLTYPLSMQFAVGYTQNLFTADPQGGGGLNLARNHAICSESWANFLFVDTSQALKPRVAQYDGGYLLVMDMGGGTTDFSVVNDWQVACGDSLGPRGRDSGFNEPFGGNILVPLLEKSIDLNGPAPAGHSAWTLTNFLAHVAEEHRKAPDTPVRDLLEFCLQSRIEVLSASDSLDFQVRVAVLGYLMCYYGAVQILSHAVNPEIEKYRDKRKGATQVETIQLYMPGAGWKIMRFVYGQQRWEVPLFSCAFETARLNYSPELPYHPEIKAPFENEAVPKASVALGAANSTSEVFHNSVILSPAGISLKAEPWYTPWVPLETAPEQASFLQELVPDPFQWTREPGHQDASLDALFPGLGDLRSFFLEGDHLQALERAHREATLTVRQEIARLGRPGEGSRSNRTPLAMYLEGFYRAYFQRPLLLTPEKELVALGPPETAVANALSAETTASANPPTKEKESDLIVYVAIQWEAGPPDLHLDFSIFLLNAQGKLPSEDHVVCFGSDQQETSDGTVTRLPKESLLGPEHKEGYRIDLSNLPAEVEEIYFVLSIWDAKAKGQTLKMVDSSSMIILDFASGGLISQDDLPFLHPEDTAAGVARLYRSGQSWNRELFYYGREGGLQMLVDEHLAGTH